ncbi:C-C chemokine receptor type 3-like [Poecilia reticulata]|uniref:C-C chemokine receptor type 3-like n=1 Tax=Poecilia reticulata TaxID=8081 RepID=A0A3P9P5V2_POERE|nr:PREDICTED: C-C chemokine receptor type 3-like [Poecilia reticulata]XP_008436714.1 PREDICTED: C-C chemokine receptor type 3-like [Poecilia reticulata]
MKMEHTTFPSYDYSDLSSEPKEPCNHDSSNLLGAHISVLYYFLFAFSLLGNGLVLIIIYRFERLTTVTNIILLNLVASSLIFMSSLPFVAAYMQISEWIFGSAMCKIVFSAYYMGFYSSVFFLTLLTFDRHLAVVYSLTAAPVRNQRYAVISCVLVWLVSGLACIRPMLIMNTFRHFNQKIYCEEYPSTLPKIDVKKLITAGFYIQLFVFLILPLAVIIYCYVRITITVISSKIATKFKTVRLIFVIVLMFFICWTPFNIVELLHGKLTTCEGKQRLSYALLVTRNMAYFYFCISPIFYTFVGRKFQNYFRHLVVSRFPSLKKYISVADISRHNTSTKMTGTEVSDGRGRCSLLRHQTDNMKNQHGNV